MSGSIRTLLLVLSPRGSVKKVKNFALWIRLKRDRAALNIWSRYFDEREYQIRHPDVAASGVDPTVHFLVLGNAERRRPGDDFDIAYYLARYPEVAESGVNALLHFALFGEREGRTLNSRVAAPIECGPEPAAAASERVIQISNQWLPGLPLVSIVVPCFNYGRFVEEAIRSALRQTFEDIEIIVVEGGSTDPETVTEVRRLESLNLPKTRFYYRAERHFAGDNRNFGIGHARGRYICCLDADDMLRPTYIEVAVFLAEIFGYDLVTPCVQCIGESTFRWMVPDPGFPAILTENHVASAALFRRAAWAHIGGYRDWGVGDNYVCEDWDFWIRMLGHGFLGVSIRELLILYRVHRSGLTSGSSLDWSRQRVRLQSANEELLNAEYRPPARKEISNRWANLGDLADDRESYLLALPFITVGGAEKLFRTLGERIVAKGKRLIVITTLTLADSIPDDANSFEKITPYVYALSKLFSNDNERREFFLWLLRRYSVAAAIMAGCEYVYHLLPEIRREFQDMVILDQLFNDTVHVFNNRHYSSFIDSTLVPSEELRNALKEKYSADPASVHVIPHGIPLPPVEGIISDLPREAAGKTIVGFFGRLSPEKAPDLFIEIARHLLRRNDRLFFVMTGDGPMRAEIQEQIRGTDVSAALLAPGFVEDVTPLMRAVDIMVLPSRIDGMPLAVLEAQALGKPVIASRVGSLPMMIHEGESGFLCEIGDVNAFCDRILQLARAPELRVRMGIAARKSVEERFSADTMFKAYEHVIETAEKNRRKRMSASCVE